MPAGLASPKLAFPRLSLPASQPPSLPAQHGLSVSHHPRPGSPLQKIPVPQGFRKRSRLILAKNQVSHPVPYRAEFKLLNPPCKSFHKLIIPRRLEFPHRSSARTLGSPGPLAFPQISSGIFSVLVHALLQPGRCLSQVSGYLLFQGQPSGLLLDGAMTQCPRHTGLARL